MRHDTRSRTPARWIAPVGLALAAWWAAAPAGARASRGGEAGGARAQSEPTSRPAGAKPVRGQRAAETERGAPAAAQAGTEPSKRTRSKQALLGLARTPAAAARSFDDQAADEQRKVAAIVARVLETLRGLDKRRLDPANKVQRRQLVGRLDAVQTQLKQAEVISRLAARHERLAVRLWLKAAEVNELVTGKKSDVKALQARKQRLQRESGDPPLQRRVRALSLLADSLRHFVDGDLAQAIVVVAKSISADDAIALAHAYQGSFHYLTQNQLKAAASWRRALELDPQNQELRAALTAVEGSGGEKKR